MIETKEEKAMVDIKRRVRMTGGQGIVEALKIEGVEKAFCVPGESFLPVIDSMFEHSKIHLISTRHENGAAFMAESYAKASGKVGVCMATRGVGSANLAIGIHTAYQDSTPMVALIGQIPRGFRGREGFQEVELSDFYSHITKWAVEISDPKRVPEIMHRAFRVAQSGRPGPVLIGLPIDMLHQEADMVFQNHMLSASPAPNRSQLEEANRLLMQASKPLIIVGGGVTRTNAQKELVQLSELTSIPVMTSFRRHDAFPNDHKHYAGQLGFAPDPKLVQYVKEADVILAIGTRFSQVMTQEYTLFQPQTSLIHIDITDEVIGKIYETAIGIMSDAKLAIEELIELNRNQAVSLERVQYCQQIRETYEKVSTPAPKYRNDFVDLEGFIHDLQEVLPDDAMISSDAGNFAGWVQRYYQFKQPNTYMGPLSGAMGYGLPGAIGAKLAHPDRIAVSIAGDGGFMFTLQELETSVRYGIPVICIVINNNMYGTIRMHQERVFPNRVIATDLTNPDFQLLAKSFGISGIVVERNDQVVDALRTAIESNVTTLIEVKTDPNVISLTSTIESLRENAKK